MNPLYRMSAAITTCVLAADYCAEISEINVIGARKDKNMGRPIKDERPERKVKSKALGKMLKRKMRK